MDLGNEVGAIWRLIPADCETQALVLQVLVVAVGVVGIAGWSIDLLVKVDLLAVANG